MAQALRIPNFLGVRPLRRDDDSHRQWSTVKTLDSPAWLKGAYDRISELTRLQVDWDTYGGLPVAPGAVSVARLLLSNLMVDDVPNPQISAVADGGIGFHWRVADRDLEIEISPAGEMHYMRTIVGGEPMEPQDVERLPEMQGALDWVTGR